jgi:hypothetical protein
VQLHQVDFLDLAEVDIAAEDGYGVFDDGRSVVAFCLGGDLYAVDPRRVVFAETQGILGPETTWIEFAPIYIRLNSSQLFAHRLFVVERDPFLVPEDCLEPFLSSLPVYLHIVPLSRFVKDDRSLHIAKPTLFFREDMAFLIRTQGDVVGGYLKIHSCMQGFLSLCSRFETLKRSGIPR